MDKLTPDARSENMRRIRGKGMKPEIAVRKTVYQLGYRYRLHASDLPGKPDLVFRSGKKAIFVHGCFWHTHESNQCGIAHMPKSNIKYWKAKLSRNKERDQKNLLALKKQGWKTLVIWECQIKKTPLLVKRIVAFMGR